jgi:glutamine amidotransferase-like uncharacterized protein
MARKTIAIFVQHPKCSVQSCNGIIKALSPHYDFKLFTKHEIEDDFFYDVDVVAFPGGVGDSDNYDHLLKYHANPIRDFIHAGGKYLGVCMGAYWAGHHYLNVLDSVTCNQYLKRPNSGIRRYYSKAIPVTWNGMQQHAFFYDGPAFIGDESKFKTVARYSNGDPMAIIQGNVGLIGCHLESERYWYNKKYLEPFYHNGIHHRLLRSFVDTLVS